MRKRKKLSAEYMKYVDDLIDQFHRMFRSPEECTMVLGGMEFSAEALPKCRKCNGELRKTKKSRAYWCKKCRMTIWITAGTFFAKKHSSTAWLLAIWLKEHGVSLASTELAPRLGVAQSSGWRIDKDLNAVMLEELEEHSGWTHSRFFREVFRRRSRETSRRKHPESEQDDCEWEFYDAMDYEQETTDGGSRESKSTAAGQRAAEDKLDNAGLLVASVGLDALGEDEKPEKFSLHEELSELEKLVYNLLSDELQQLEAICAGLELDLSIGAVFSALTMLELKGLVQSFPGNFFARAKTKDVSQSLPVSHADMVAQSLSLDSGIEAFLQYICDVFQGISRKYLQNYLAGYWIKVSSRWQNGALLRACLARSAPWCSTIVHQVSPLVVRIPLAESSSPLLLTG